MKIVSILFLSFLFSTLSFAQSKVSDLSVNKHLNQLKNGVLFVQLPRIENKKLEILEKSKSKKNRKYAEEIRTKNLLLQKEVQDGFINNYTFSEIYFIESKNTKELLKCNFSNILKDKKGNIATFNNEPTIEKYIATYGIASVPGKNVRYNGDGILIRYINIDTIEQIDSDIFFESTSRFMGFIFGNKSIEKVISNLNNHFSKKHAVNF